MDKEILCQFPWYERRDNPCGNRIDIFSEDLIFEEVHRDLGSEDTDKFIEPVDCRKEYGNSRKGVHHEAAQPFFEIQSLCRRQGSGSHSCKQLFYLLLSCKGYNVT